MDTQALVIQLRFSAWASKRALESTVSIARGELVRDLGNSKFNETENAGGLYGALAHIYQADSIWFDRLMGKPTTNLAVYDAPLDLAELSARWEALHQRYAAWSEGLSPADWDRVVAYKNLKGDVLQTAVWQIVLHLVNHASYHRGQITTMLRQLGRTPINTDLITYYRETSRA